MTAFAAFVLALPSITVVPALTLTSPSLILPVGSANANMTSLEYTYQCDGPRYGYDVDRASCAEALSQSDASSRVSQSYGQRFTGPFDVKLPRRYISSSRNPFYSLIVSLLRVFLARKKMSPRTPD